MTSLGHPMTADILTVTLNPTLDVSTSVDRLVNHVKLRCSPEQEQVGGGGINVAHVVHSLGGRCQAMLPTGGTRGEEIAQRLHASGLPVVAAPIAQQNRECFNVFETGTGHEYRFVLPGPTLSQQEQQACIESILQSLPNRFLVLSGSLPPGVPDGFYAQIVESVRDRAPAIKVVVDASGAALQHALDAGVYLIKPSREEFEALTQTSQTSPAQTVSLCQSLIASGRVHVVALTLGDRGSVIVTAQQAWQVKPLAVEVTSTVGAGDSFVGGLIWSLTHSDDWVRAAGVATACAGAALQTQGALRFDASTVMHSSQGVEVQPLAL